MSLRLRRMILLLLAVVVVGVVRSDTECGDGWNLGGRPFDDGTGKKDYFCYRTTKKGAYTWQQAEQECVNFGENAHLISIHSDAENEWVGDHFKQEYLQQNDAGPVYRGFWIGMKRVPADGSFAKPFYGTFVQTWSDGSPVNYGQAITNNPQGSGGPWAPLQPDYSATFETCVMSYAFYEYWGSNPFVLAKPEYYNKWNDLVCHDERVPDPKDRRFVNGKLVQGICKKPAVPCPCEDQ